MSKRVSLGLLLLPFIGYAQIDKDMKLKDSLSQAEPEKTTELQTLEIIGRAREDYNSDYSFSSSKIALKNMEISQAISTVTKELLADRQSFRVGETLKNVTGINTTSFYSHYSIRGVTQGFGNRDNNRLINGMTAFVSFINQPLTVNIERIEVIKGPASITFSSTNPGGTINMVTKKPLNINKKEVSFTIGSYNTIRSTLDFTGPINKAKDLLYRINIGYENSQSFRDLQHNKSYVIAPTISYIPSEKTRINLELVIDNLNTKLDRGQPIFGIKKGQNTPLNTTPINFAIGAANDYNKNTNVMIMSSLSHQFHKDIGLNMAYMKYIWDEDLLEHRTANKFAKDIKGKDIPTLVEMRVSRREQKVFSDNFNAFINANVAIGKLQNKIVLGYDLNGFEVSKNGGWNQARGYKLKNGKIANSFKAANANAYVTDANGNPVPNVPHFDLENPKYYLEHLNNYTFKKDGITPLKYTSNGIYFIDMMTYGKFIFNWGIRQEWFVDKVNYKYANERVAKQKKFLKRFGIVFQASENINLYSSYIEGFEVQTEAYLGSTRYGGPFDPMSSKMIEGGLKTEWLKGKLNANITYFNIYQKNVLTDDPNDSDELKRQGADQRSQGIEVDVMGRIFNNLQINAGYSFIDANLKEDRIKYRKENTPKHSFNLWTRYNVTQGIFKNFGVGMGLNYVGSKIAWLDRDLVIPDYTLLDGAIYYKLKNIQISANVNNVLNKKHWLGAFNYTRLFPGAPRNIILNLRYSF